MAQDGKTRASDDIWHLSLEDLFAPTTEAPRSSDPGPSVITLKTSSSVIGLPPKGLLGFDALRVYQLMRTEAGRPQYLLRLGIIDSELEADAILQSVREHYPRAIKDAAGDDDKTAFARAVSVVEPPKPMRSRPVETATRVGTATRKIAPTPRRADAQSTPPVRWNIDELLPELADMRPAEREPAPVSARAVESRGGSEPNEDPIPRAVVEATELDPDAVTDEVEVLTLKTEPRPCADAVLPPPAEQRQVDVPAMDSTQTVRALTPIEIGADAASQWFAIQLYLGEERLNAEQVPNLDIFDEYRLYSVAGLDENRIVHALRVGFFSSEPAAQAVAGYLAAFFDAPSIKRVSIAERERFAERRVAARKDVGAAGAHAVIELVGPAPLPERRSKAAPAGTGTRRAGEATSLWSRLIAPRANKH